MKKEMEKLISTTREMMVLSNIGALLGWDQETYMPSSGVAERAEQIACIQGLLHEKATDPEIGSVLRAFGCSEEQPGGDEGLDPKTRGYLRAVYREHSRAVRLPARLVTDLARGASLSQAAWIRARKEDDFASFAPHLDKMLALNREKAECLGYGDHPYDALLDEYEPWMKTADIRRVFSELGSYLKTLLMRIADADRIDDDFFLREYPVDLQEAFGRVVLEKMGFTEERGRMDTSAHPFTTTIGGDDVRITTRYNKNSFKICIFSIIHEAGHALYELGFGSDIKGNILAQGTSLGIHESQSRTWENMIGRSREFWVYFFPVLREFFPMQLDGVDLEAMYRAVNKVEPSLIRTEADEVTYSMHIILRFELELALIEKNLSVSDLPSAWNEKMKDLLGIMPPSDADGVLQDIHWSMGAFGYFPTYALGNLYSAQFLKTFVRDVPDFKSRIADGDLGCLGGWLREKVHSPGSIYTATELLERVSGEKLGVQAFTEYLEEKYSDVYQLSGM